jgi:hypothetical protein
VLLHQQTLGQNFFLHTSRVTRLGEFIPIGRLFSFGSFLKITEGAHFFGYFYSTYKSMYYYVLQTHLVGSRCGSAVKW